jgi:hypothetical protein
LIHEKPGVDQGSSELLLSIKDSATVDNPELNHKMEMNNFNHSTENDKFIA